MKFRIANMICVVRIVSSFVAAAFLLQMPTASGKYLALIVMASSIFLDAVDGKIARYFGQDDEIGTLADLYADHIFANAVWVCLASLNLVSVWVPLLTTSRDLVVDWFRQSQYILSRNGFSQVGESRIGWLCTSRQMRALYGGAKVVAWGLILMPFASPLVITTAIWIAVTLCMVRALPPITHGWHSVLLLPNSRS